MIVIFCCKGYVHMHAIHYYRVVCLVRLQMPMAHTTLNVLVLVQSPKLLSSGGPAQHL